MLRRFLFILGWLVLVFTFLVHLFGAVFWGNWDQDNTGYSVGVMATFMQASKSLIASYVVGMGLIVVSRLAKGVK